MRRRNIVIGAWLIVIVLGLLASTGIAKDQIDGLAVVDPLSEAPNPFL